MMGNEQGKECRSIEKGCCGGGEKNGMCHTNYGFKFYATYDDYTIHLKSALTFFFHFKKKIKNKKSDKKNVYRVV